MNFSRTHTLTFSTLNPILRMDVSSRRVEKTKFPLDKEPRNTRFFQFKYREWRPQPGGDLYR